MPGGENQVYRGDERIGPGLHRAQGSSVPVKIPDNAGHLARANDPRRPMAAVGHGPVLPGSLFGTLRRPWHG